MSTVPTLLVHGIWDTSDKMRHIAQDLREAGHKVFLIDLVPADGRVGVEELALQIQNLVEEKKLAKFNIIGFSLGGIVSSYYITELGGADRVCSFVTISSPHHGTKTAYFSPFILGKQLRPHSSMLVSLAKKMKELWLASITQNTG